MDHATWIHSFITMQSDTILIEIPSDLMPTLIYYCVPICLSQLFKLDKTIADQDEYKQAHVKSGVLCHKKCDHCHDKITCMKLDNLVFCFNCILDHNLTYRANGCCTIFGINSNVCRRLDEDGFRKKEGDDYRYPEAFSLEEKRCTLCRYYNVPNSCLFCRSTTMLLKLYHWVCDSEFNDGSIIYHSKLITLNVCQSCLTKNQNDPAFGKYITYVCPS